MSVLFASTSIKKMVLSNRFVRSATWEGMAADDGGVTERLIDVQTDLARGGVGLIISGHAFVSPEGRAGRWQLGVYSDHLVSGLTAMAEAVHQAGGTIAMQLAHAGSFAATTVTGEDRRGPSPMATDSGPVGREMTEKDREEVKEAFARGAERAKKAGFDAVQIHAAHGYLLCQFLSPYFNKREDEYGGPIENRVRFPLEVLAAVRKAVGPDFPVLIKINSEDFLPGGLSVEEMIRAVTALREAGIDAVEVSGGTFLSGKNSPSRIGRQDPEAYHEAAAARLKAALDVPVMLVGGICTFETAERAVTSGATDYISLCRPLIREPGLVNRWKSGDRTPARCVSECGCFTPGFEGKGVYCVVDEREQKRAGS